MLDDTNEKKADEDRERLRDKLGQMLLSQNLIVLLGSGASVAVGGPSMTDLWNEAKSSQAAVFSKICDEVGHPETQNNIEDLLSRCQGVLAFNKKPADLVKPFVEAVEKIIRDKCREIEKWGASQNPSKSVSDTISPYSTLLSRIVPRRQDLPRTRIYTTNYDLCIETAAKEKRMPALDGFDLTNPRTFDGRWFDYDFVRRSIRDGAPDYLESVFHLYKLHGSVDWHLSSSGIIQTPSTDKPYLIYPRQEKFALSYDQPFLEMMSRFQMVLREKDTTLLIVGFGFNDHHLNQPIYHALATNPGLKITIVDYSPEQKLSASGQWKLLHNLQKLGAAVDFIQIDFNNFPSLIPTYSEARANNTQEKAAHFLRVLSEKK